MTELTDWLQACLDEDEADTRYWLKIHREQWNDALRDIEAKQAILNLHQPEAGQHPDFCGHDLHEMPCRTLRLLASAYRHRFGYDEVWRP